MKESFVENLVRLTRNVGSDGLRYALRLRRYANTRLFDRAMREVEMPRGLRARVGWALVLVGALGCPRPLHAESVGSPASILKKGQWIFGLRSGGMRRGKLNGQGKVTFYQFGHFRGYGLTDRLSVYVNIGGVYLQVDDPAIKKPQDPSTTNSFKGNFLLSGQVKGRIWERAGWEWDGSLQVVEIRARHRGRNEIRWHEADLATSVAKSFGRLKPYVGVKASFVNALFHVRKNGEVIKQGRYKLDAPVGPFLGTDVYFGEHEDVVINVETSYVSGPELGMSMSYTF